MWYMVFAEITSSSVPKRPRAARQFLEKVEVGRKEIHSQVYRIQRMGKKKKKKKEEKEEEREE